jgi:hypothetical protein
MWNLAQANPKYRRAMDGMYQSKELSERLELAETFWILGAIFSLNSLGGMEFGNGEKFEFEVTQNIETGEILVTGPEIFLRLPAVETDEASLENPSDAKG